MHLSILIPTYNHDWTPLAKELIRQAIGLPSHTIEIIVMDDASDNETDTIEGIKYIHLKENVGRSRIRNLLANEAQGDHILFLDDDVFPCENTFLKDFTSHTDKGVLVGGLRYRKTPQIGTLRYKYGKNHEQTTAEERKKAPYHSFLSCAFMIDIDSFKIIHFDESYKGYGHEDTKFGIDLCRNNIPICHIDAPIYHDDTDSNERFLKKTEIAIDSLLNHRDSATDQSRLMRMFLQLKRYHVDWVFKVIYKCFGWAMKYNLISKYPSITIYNLYKMGYLAAKY